MAKIDVPIVVQVQVEIDDGFRVLAPDRPSRCRICSERFKGDLALQLQISHTLLKFDPLQAEQELNERYQDWHDFGHGHRKANQ